MVSKLVSINVFVVRIFDELKDLDEKVLLR